MTVGQSAHGMRLDRLLVELAPEFSRNYLQQLIEQGCVQVEARTATRAAQKMRLGQSLTIELRPTPVSQAFVPQSMDLRVVYEDESILVLDKSAGLVVHPAPGHWSGTLLNGLLARDARAATLPRAGIVHRLDKDTSGLMVVARSRAAMDALVRQIAAREVKREYLAIAHHRWQGSAEKVIEGWMGRDARQRTRMAVVHSTQTGAKSANTFVALLANGQAVDACLLRCTLGTGRTHQIRVHMASIGHALIADELYGGAPMAGMERQALHARRLAFAHPISAEALDFECALPDDFAQALSTLGLAQGLGGEV